MAQREHTVDFEKLLDPIHVLIQSDNAGFLVYYDHFTVTKDYYKVVVGVIIRVVVSFALVMLVVEFNHVYEGIVKVQVFFLKECP